MAGRGELGRSADESMGTTGEGAARQRFGRGAAFIQGAVVPIHEARIPIVDSGFTHSDVTYDVVSVWHGRFFRLDDHLDRFLHNASKLRLRLEHDRTAVRQILLDLVARTGIRDAYVSMMVTRGWSPSGSRDLRTYANQFYAYVLPFVWVFSPEQQQAGVRAVISPVERISDRAVDPRVKNYHWGDLIRATWDAVDRGNETGILLDRYANVTEGPGFNVFAVVDGVLRTPKTGCLLGITRQTVLEIAAEAGIPAQVGDLPVAELRSAQELFFTTTAGGVMPVRTLDDRPVGDEFPGPITTSIREQYWRAHDDPRYATDVDYG